MAQRKSFNRKERARLFSLYAGRCHLCEGRIDATEAWEIEHRIPWALTQDDSDDNLRLAHVKCHKRKTHEEDRPRISKAERQRAKHLGTWPRSKAKIQSRGFSKSRSEPEGIRHD